MPRIGVRRNITAETLRTATTVKLRDGRRLWRVTIASEGAIGLRVHFRRFGAAGGQLWVYVPPQSGQPIESQGPYSDGGPFGDGEFWTKTLQGEAATVEYLEGEPNAEGALPPFEIDQILHLWPSVSPEAPSINNAGEQPADAAMPPTPNETNPAPATAAYCHLDVTCYPQYQNMSKAVVQFDFMGDDGSEYVCSGSMVNTRNSSFKPYLLTAHHCIGSDAEARSIQAYFFYQTAACNGLPPFKLSLPSITGGRYLAGAPISQGDYALVLLNGQVPAGVYYLGWNKRGPNLGDSGVGIHHPMGSWKRISFGSRTADGDTLVAGQLAPGNLYYRVSWSQGKTEGGSSGSPLINNVGQIVGTLTYGPLLPPGSTVCDLNPEVAGYARFGDAYPALSPYLEDTPPPSLTVTPTSLSFVASNGQYSGPSLQTITISTQSLTSLSYAASASAPWIKLSSLSGTVSAFASSVSTVGIDLSYFLRSTVAAGTVSISSGTLTPIQVSIQVSVTVTASKVDFSVSPNPVYQQAADADGYSWFYTVTISESAGVSTNLTSFKIGGIDYSTSITSWFGANVLPAGGTLSAGLRTRGLSVPVNLLFQAGGTDAGTGQPWTAQIAVPFLARSPGGLLSMDSSPSLIRQNPNSVGCPWYQQLVLQETGGFGVTLTRFLAGGHDLSGQIASYWGSAQLPASGSLLGGICWSGIEPPNTLEVEIDGTDTKGFAISARTNGSFSGPPANPTTMSAVPVSVALNTLAGSTARVTGTISLSLGSSTALWSGRLVFPKPPNTWLVVSPLSGSGPATLNVSAQPAGLAQGTYDATLVLQSLDAVPQLLNIQVKLIIEASSTGPSITSVTNGASFQPGIASSTWVTIVGTNLAPITRMWQASDFVGNLLPTSLNGVSVTINGKPAPVYYISPTQLNVLVPDDAALGPVAVEVVTPQGRSTTVMADKRTVSPGWFMFDPERRKYIAAVHLDGVYLGKPGLYQGLNFRPATPGDVVLLFGTGFGQTDPATPAGQLVTQPGVLTTPVVVRIGGVMAQVAWAGLVGSGLYQFNVVIPNVPDGDQAVVAEIGGTTTQGGAYITVAVQK